jgi:hypothetical protein
MGLTQVRGPSAYGRYVTLFGVISPGLRAGLLVAIGSALLSLPFVLGLSVAAMATGVAVAVLAIGLGLAGTAPEGRGTLPLAAHAAYDLGLAVGLLLAAAAFGVSGDTSALLFFTGAGLVQFVLRSVTRYSIRPARRRPAALPVRQSFSS